MVLGGCQKAFSSPVPVHPPVTGLAVSTVGPVSFRWDGATGRLTCLLARSGTVDYALVWPEGWSYGGDGVFFVGPADSPSKVAMSDMAVLSGVDRPPPWPELGDCPAHGRVFWVTDAERVVLPSPSHVGPSVSGPTTSRGQASLA
jgi:hypothetical protein